MLDLVRLMISKYALSSPRHTLEILKGFQIWSALLEDGIYRIPRNIPTDFDVSCRRCGCLHYFYGW